MCVYVFDIYKKDSDMSMRILKKLQLDVSFKNLQLERLFLSFKNMLLHMLARTRILVHTVFMGNFQVW